jgi:hypothetical protein
MNTVEDPMIALCERHGEAEVAWRTEKDSEESDRKLAIAEDILSEIIKTEPITTESYRQKLLCLANQRVNEMGFARVILECAAMLYADAR